MQLTAYQRRARDQHDIGLILRLWRRQGGKTTYFALAALRIMAAIRNSLVTFASASLLVGREVTHKESSLYRDLVADYATLMAGTVEVNSIDTANGLTPVREDDFADCFAAGRLETRLYHDRTSYSRTLVVAPNPATARGFSGFVKIDEIGWIKDLRDLWDAMEPIFSRDASFRCELATTPPADDTHFAHELALPPVGLTFPTPDAAGHMYRSQAGILVHRVDVWDAMEAGVQLFDQETRQPLTPEEHRAKSLNRAGWDINYALKSATGGTSACSAIALNTAQSQALSTDCIAVDTDEEIPINWAASITDGAVGIGIDLATTEQETSNPTALAVVERLPGSGLCVVRLLARWKTADPARSRAIYRDILTALRTQRSLRPRGLGIDASNERYFATDLRRELAPLVTVTLMISSEKAVYRGEEMSTKEYLGNLLVNTLEDAQLVLPPERWVQEDFRLVKKDKGRFTADVDTNGNHADTFDAVKIALDRLSSRGGRAEASAAGVGGFGQVRADAGMWKQQLPEDTRTAMPI